MQSRSGLSPLVADDLHHARLHQDELEAAVQGRAKHLEHTISSGGQGGQEHVTYVPPPKPAEPLPRRPQISKDKVEGSGSQPGRENDLAL